MTMNNQGRPTSSGSVNENELATISGDRGLQHEVSLIFELGRPGMTGVDIPQVQMSDARASAVYAAMDRWDCRGSASRK